MRNTPCAELAALLRQAVACHGRGEATLAARLYADVLRRDPNQADAHNLLGLLARQSGDMTMALRHTARALALRPNEPVFLASHGAALAEAGRLPEAISKLRQAVAKRPSDAISLRNLGQALCAMGDAKAALAPLRQAVALQPTDAEPHLALAHARREAGDLPGAIASAEAALLRADPAATQIAVTGTGPSAAATGTEPGAAATATEPGAAAAVTLAEQARFLLASLGQSPPPDRAPPAYVRDLFDQFAPRFEAELIGRLAYRTPQALVALLAEAGVPKGLDVLDLGCGTGLSGAALAPFARRLEGLDLSPRMLAEAAKRQIYAALHEAELVGWLPGRPAAFSLIAAADVLNYLGDLAPALAGLRGALTPGGWLAFSIEAGEVAPYELGATMRYRHQPDHVAGLAQAAGFLEVARRAVPLRTEKTIPVPGVLFLFTRR